MRRSIWVLTIGLSVLAGAAEGQVWQTVTLPDGPGPDTPIVTDVTTDGGTVWFSTLRDGLMAFDGSEWVVHWAMSGGLRSNSYHNTILVDADGDKWTCKDHWRAVDRIDDAGTLSNKDDDTWFYYSEPNQLESPRIFSMAQDLAGNMWFGIRDENSNQPTIVELLIEGDPDTTSDDEWRGYGKAGDPALFFARDVRALAVDHQNRLWVLLFQSGLDVWSFGDYYTFDDDEIVHYAQDTGLPSNAVRSVLVGADGRVWVGTDDGLAVFDDTSETWTTIEGFPGDSVLDIAQDAQGHIWLATDQGVSMLYSGGALARSYDEADGLDFDKVVRIAVESDGTVWAVTEDEETSQTYLSRLESGFGPESSILVYPNPWKEGESAEPITLLGAPDGSKVEVFDLTGELVRTLSARNEPFLWDSLDDEFKEVPSGVYILRVETPAGEHTFTKVAIIR